MSLYKGNNLIAGGGSLPNLLTYQWTDHILNNISWLRADTFSWHLGSVYTAVYEHLLDDYESSTKNLTETVAGHTINYNLGLDGHKIVTDTSAENINELDNIYKACGNAWYYVLDTTNTKFKLPRKHSSQIVRNVKNSDGSWYILYADGWIVQGGVITGLTDWADRTITFPIPMKDRSYTYSASPIMYTSTGSGSWAVGVTLKTETQLTSRFYSNNGYLPSWQIEGQSSIDPSTLLANEKYLYFYVGQYTQTVIQQTAGITSEALNSKFDKSQIQVVDSLPSVLAADTIYLIKE